MLPDVARVEIEGEIQYLRNMLKSEKLYDIVLNKYQLELLKDYL